MGSTPLCYIDQPVTFKDHALLRESSSLVLMASSDQVPCTLGQKPIHNINGVFKAQKLEAVFMQAWGVGGGRSHLTRLYSDGKNILVAPTIRQTIAFYGVFHSFLSYFHVSWGITIQVCLFNGI
jgi:hypothetical protein